MQVYERRIDAKPRTPRNDWIDNAGAPYNTSISVSDTQNQPLNAADVEKNLYRHPIGAVESDRERDQMIEKER